MEHKTTGVCATSIDFDIVDGILRNIKFNGGCPGNLKAISILLDGTNAKETALKLKDIKCGMRDTSCTDQLSKIILNKLNKVE